MPSVEITVPRNFVPEFVNQNDNERNTNSFVFCVEEEKNGRRWKFFNSINLCVLVSKPELSSLCVSNLYNIYMFFSFGPRVCFANMRKNETKNNQNEKDRQRH